MKESPLVARSESPVWPPSVVLAGGTVLLALGGLQFSGLPDFATMGYATALVALVTLLAAVTLMPALLGLLKMRVYSRRNRRAGHLESTMSHSRTAARFADATLIRLVVVPAAMALLGRANWYFPSWLDGVLPTLDPHGSPSELDVPADQEREPVLVG